jgi:hypothetical protein
MFPNLRQLVLSIEFMPSRSTHSVNSPFQFTHSTTKLEKIKDYGDCELTRQLAMSNMCSNLQSLELFFVNLPGLLSSDIISQLKKYSSFRNAYTN